MREGGQKVQTSNYKISKSWDCNVEHGDYSQYCIVYLNDAKKVNLKSSHHRKKQFVTCMITDLDLSW